MIEFETSFAPLYTNRRTTLNCYKREKREGKRKKERIVERERRERERGEKVRENSIEISSSQYISFCINYRVGRAIIHKTVSMESECSIYSLFALLSRPICSNTNHHF
jgi:hypothetical protein